MPEPSLPAGQPDKAVQAVVGCAAALLAVCAVLGAFVLVRGALSGRIAAPALGVGLAFLVIGGGGLALVRWVWVQTVQRERRKALAPDQPWSWDRDIRDGVVKGNRSSSTAVVLSALVAFWLAAMAIVTTVVQPGSGSLDSNQFRWLLALIWAVGLLLAAAAVVAIRRHLRFGVSHLVLDTTPLRLGAWASGLIEGPAAVQGAEVEIQIHCLRRTRGHRSSHSEVLWRTTKVLDAGRCERRDGHLEIPFAVQLPHDPAFVHRDVTWHVGVTAKLPGVDYDESFHVPVAAPDPGAPPADARPPRAMPELAGDRLMQHLPSRVEHRADADVFVFPLKVSFVLWPLVLAAITIGMPLLRDASPLAAWPEVVLTWTPIVCGVLAVLSIVALLFDPRRVEVRADTIRIRRGVLGVGVHRTLAVKEVAAVLDQASSGSPPTYAVKIRLHDGKSCDVASTIREPAEAKALATRLRQILQIGDR